MKKINLTELYNIMYNHMDPNGWWPARSDWEVIWSTILTQNTNSKNVALASESLRKATDFLPRNILKLSNKELENVISAAGFYTRKAQTIKNVASFFMNQYNCDLEKAQ